MDDVDRLFRTYQAPLVRYLTRRLGDRDWAEEVAQETFLRALRHGPVAQERAWLFAVATNLVRDEARRDARRRRHLELLREEEPAYAEPEPTTLERAQEMALARRAVDALAERDRLALLMREEGLDYQEIATALGLSVGSVGTTLARARRRLVEAWEAIAGPRDEARRGAPAPAATTPRAGGTHAAS
jgi:RNA polymerase sigma-70 factor (ECF subfamily)